MDSVKFIEIIHLLLDTYKTVLFICLGVLVLLVLLMLIFKKQRIIFNLCVSLTNIIMLVFGGYTISLYATALLNKIIGFDTSAIIALIIGLVMWVATRFVPAKKRAPKSIPSEETSEE